MAEGLLRHLAPGRYGVVSAGSHAAGFVHPLAVRALSELGIDISRHVSRNVREFLPPDPGEGSAPRPELAPPDLIVSLCDLARAHCPHFPEGTGRIHWPMFDPILVDGNEDFRLAAFRGVRDEIRSRIEEALETGELDGAGEAFGPPPRRGLDRLFAAIDQLRPRSRPRGEGP